MRKAGAGVSIEKEVGWKEAPKKRTGEEMTPL